MINGASDILSSPSFSSWAERRVPRSNLRRHAVDTTSQHPRSLTNSPTN